MMKVQVQTSKSFPSRFGPALLTMIRQRDGLRFPFGSLGPLWSRQILGTMANFFTFENTVEGIYSKILTGGKDSYSSSTQLLVTLAAGYVSGFVATVVSQPADTLISIKSRMPEKTLRQIVREVGWAKLCTNGFGPRVMLTGPIIAFQWLVYDTFKVAMGMGTTGGNADH